MMGKVVINISNKNNKDKLTKRAKLNSLGTTRQQEFENEEDLKYT